MAIPNLMTALINCKMESTYKAKMSSLSQEYETPDEIFIPLNNEFKFELDGCASSKNHKVTNYYSKQDDCFTKKWNKVTWVNPEFYTVRKFVKKAFEDSRDYDSTVVILILVKSNTNWWRDYIMKSKEVRFINQKVQFKNTAQGLRFPACIVVFAPHTGDTKFSVFDQTAFIYKTT